LSTAQLARDTGLTPQGIRRVLDGLAGQGIVTVFGQGRSQVYAIAARHPLAAALGAVFAAERARVETVMRRLRDALSDRDEVAAAWLYGSVARGEDDPASDIDLALVLRADPAGAGDAVREALRQLEDELQVSLSVVTLTDVDAGPRSTADSWWSELIRDARVLKGETPERFLARVRREPAVP
jgi:predicted nucleotidyltransferase